MGKKTENRARLQTWALTCAAAVSVIYYNHYYRAVSTCLNSM